VDESEGRSSPVKGRRVRSELVRVKVINTQQEEYSKLHKSLTEARFIIYSVKNLGIHISWPSTVHKVINSPLLWLRESNLIRLCEQLANKTLRPDFPRSHLDFILPRGGRFSIERIWRGNCVRGDGSRC